MTRWGGAAAGLIVLLGLPLVGVFLKGEPLTNYTEFPPVTRYVEHAAFSWPMFIFFSLVAAGLFLPLAGYCGRAWAERPRQPAVRSFPLWGWMGVAWTMAAWVLAWTRFKWFAPCQPFTFSPLWFGYIVVVNALAFRKAGACLLTHRTRFLLILFPVSAVFWWYFEYLNRFVQNWYYEGVEHMTGSRYFWMATLPFSTVLPAVLSTADYLAKVLGRPVVAIPQGRLALWPRSAAWGLIGLSALGLALLAVFPDYLFPLLWLSPLFILSGIRLLTGRGPLEADEKGDLVRRAVLLAAAALICGFFWEMWNFYSLARWKYAVPFVNRFRLFEMPILGYTGYLPFGLECALVADALRAWLEPQKTPGYSSQGGRSPTTQRTS